MITLYDYLPSQNGYKVRLLLSHLRRPYRTKPVAIFDGEGRSKEFLAKSPTGAVPVLELDDGRVLTESNAILGYLAEGTAYLPVDAWERAQVSRWMYFEEDLIQNGLASLRHWTMTGKLARRSTEMIAAKQAVSGKTLQILDTWLAARSFLTDSGYTIVAVAILALLGQPAAHLVYPPVRPEHIAIAIIAPLGEEYGWRAFALRTDSSTPSIPTLSTRARARSYPEGAP